jgi:hypothetical protein
MRKIAIESGTETVGKVHRSRKSKKTGRTIREEKTARDGCDEALRRQKVESGNAAGGAV